MANINWDEVFEEQIERCPGADDAEIEKFVTTVGQPLSDREIQVLHEQNVVHPETWILPNGPLPESYLSLLRWSNGGQFRNGDRLIQFFPTCSEKYGVLAYEMPEKCPGVLPFAFNGGGIFYAFNMRFHPVNGEYEIVAVECGGGMPDTHFKLERSFPEACQSRISIETLWDEDCETTRPMCDECGEYLVCPGCGKRGPVTRY